MIENPTRGEAQLNLLFSRKTVAEELIRDVGLEIEEIRQGRQEEVSMAKSRPLSQTKTQSGKYWKQGYASWRDDRDVA